ncbi:hypothetical protein C8J57DRAFT_1630658 [Mycena rebaudengoi]|nr:hypothetical protein C8J57DRAFT_1630658 [Mycena rebaudengoi]
MHSSTAKQLARDFLHALTAKDAEKLSALVSDDFTVQVLSASVGFPALNKEQWIQTELRVNAVVPNLKFEEPDEIMVADNAIVLHTKVHGSTDTGMKYSNEFIYILRINKDGKISSTTEFVDSKAVEALIPLVT